MTDEIEPRCPKCNQVIVNGAVAKGLEKLSFAQRIPLMILITFLILRGLYAALHDVYMVLR